MGIYDSIIGKVKCPKTAEESEIEVQFKWGDPSFVKHNVGDQLKIGPYGNIWIQDNYICRRCSEYEKAEVGSRLKNAVEHDVLVHLDQGSILELIAKEEFEARFTKDGNLELPVGQKVVDGKILY